MKRLVVFVLMCSALSSAAGKPNILFIAVDDLKPILGCYGDEAVSSPRIDALAEQGTVFLNAHCQQAVCGPSRASLLTGLRPDSTQVWDLKTRIRDILPDVVTLPQYFIQNGYTAVGTGKIFDPRSVDGRQTDDPASWSRPYVQFPQNPDSEFGCLNAEFVAKVRELNASGVKGGGRLKKKLGGTPPVEIDQDVPDNAYDDGMIAETGIGLINELAPKDEPFFIAVGFKKPHLPFVAPKKYADLYQRSQFKPHPVKTAPEGAPEYAVQPGWELRNGSYSDVPLLSEGDVPIADEMQVKLIHGYYACVSYIDAQVGKLMDALKATGEADNTVVILWGDHGWHLGDHGIWCKHTNYEQATRVPMLIADLRAPKGQKNSSPAEFVDIYPTLCELAGLAVPEVLEGDSLKPILDGSQTAIKDVAVSQYTRHVPGHGEAMGYAYRDTRYRYVEWVKKDFRVGETGGTVLAREFYDYKADPQELRNLINDPEYIREVNRMKGISNAFHKKQESKTVRRPAAKNKTANTSNSNILLNPNFSDGEIKPWKMQSKLDAELSAANGNLTVTMSGSSETASHRMLCQFDLDMNPETKYLLQFDARTDAANGKNMKVSIARSVNWKLGHYGLMRNETPGAEWEPYKYQFKTKEITTDDPACIKLHLGELNGNTQFRNFLLKKAGKKK